MQVDQKGLHDERAESRESGEMAGGVEVDQPCIEEGEQPIGDRLGNPTLHARQQARRGVHRAGKLWTRVKDLAPSARGEDEAEEDGRESDRGGDAGGERHRADDGRAPV